MLYFTNHVFILFGFSYFVVFQSDIFSFFFFLLCFVTIQTQLASLFYGIYNEHVMDDFILWLSGFRADDFEGGQLLKQ